MRYEVLLRKQPEKYPKKLDEGIKKLFNKSFERLEETPHEIARPLHGELEGLYKVAIGKRRMIIVINELKKQIDVLEIGPRGDIYK